MRRALWLVAVIATSIVVAAAGVSTPVHACSCGDRLPVRDEVGAAPMSFIGTVVTRESNADGTVTADEMLVDYRVVDSVTTVESGISTIKSWRVAAGTPGAVET